MESRFNENNPKKTENQPPGFNPARSNYNQAKIMLFFILLNAAEDGLMTTTVLIDKMKEKGLTLNRKTIEQMIDDLHQVINYLYMQSFTPYSFVVQKMRLGKYKIPTMCFGIIDNG